MNLKGAFDATIGRRLVFRVLLFGIFMLGAISITVGAVDRLIVRPRMQVGGAPALTRMLVMQTLEQRFADPDKFKNRLTEIRDHGRVGLSVYNGDDTLLDGGMRPLPPISASTRAELVASPTHVAHRACDDFPCDVVAIFSGPRLVTYAVISPPPPPGAFRHDAGVLLGVVFFLLAVISIPVARSIVLPLEKLGALSRELGAGNLAVRADASRRDEVGDLARAFNDMAERVQKLRHAEKELLANVSHELRTPLARMRVVIELASDSDPAKVKRYLRDISEDLSELETLLEEVIDSARLDLVEGKAVNPYAASGVRVEIGVLVDEVTERFRERYGRTIAFKMPDEPINVIADRVMLRRVIDNLVDNARKYSPEDKPIAIEVSTVGDGARVRVAVVDEGRGISADDLPHVFTSFFRADRSRTRNTGGVGLGLSLARRIVEAHGGQIDLSSELGKGTRIWFDLSVAPQAV
jgi:two-component system, OmpR family, sensor kinase